MKINPAIFSLSLAAILLSQTSCIPVAIVGGAGVVGYNASKDRTLGTTLDDAGIEAAISAKYIANRKHTDYGEVNIKSVDHRVLLTGLVPTREARMEAYDMAFETKGVEEVINEIKVNPDTSYSASDIASDAWIGTQIKSRLLFAKDVAGVNYTTETIRGVVYLMGNAQDQAELNRAAQIASEVSGVKKVISYVKVNGTNTRSIKSNEQSNANRNPAPATAKEQAPALAEPVIMEESPNAQ